MEQPLHRRPLGVVENQLEFFSFHPPVQRSLFGNPLSFIVPGNRFEVSFQSNISPSSPCSFISKSQSENFPFVWDLITKHESFLYCASLSCQDVFVLISFS